MYRRPLCSRLERPRHGAAHISSHGLEGVSLCCAPRTQGRAKSMPICAAPWPAAAHTAAVDALPKICGVQGGRQHGGTFL